MSLPTLTRFWSPRTLAVGQAAQFQFGRLRLWLSRGEGEWGYATETLAEPAAPAFEVLAAGGTLPEAGWKYAAFGQSPERLQLLPAVPPRPVAVRPEHPVSLPPRQSSTVFAFIPTWIELWAGGSPDGHQIATLPTATLSGTWFGNPMAGELAYALRIAATRHLGQLKCHPHHLVCPITIENSSDEPLEFQKLCLRTVHLAIFAGQHHYWTNPVSIRYAGKAREARVTYARHAPAYETGLELISKADEPAERVFVGLTFKHPAATDFQAI